MPGILEFQTIGNCSLDTPLFPQTLISFIDWISPIHSSSTCSFLGIPIDSLYQHLVPLRSLSLSSSTLLHLIFFFSNTQDEFILFYFIFIGWRLIALQYCSGFCHTLTWNSHGFTFILHPDPPSHLPPHPIPLLHLILTSFCLIENQHSWFPFALLLWMLHKVLSPQRDELWVTYGTIHPLFLCPGFRSFGLVVH